MRMKRDEYRTWRMIVLAFNILLHVALFLSLTNLNLNNLLRRQPSYFEFSTSFSEGNGKNPNLTGGIQQINKNVIPESLKKEDVQADPQKIVRVDNEGAKIFSDSADIIKSKDSLTSQSGLDSEGLANDTSNIADSSEFANGPGSGNGTGTGNGKKPNYEYPKFMGKDADFFGEWIRNQYYNQVSLLSENFLGVIMIEFRIDKSGNLTVESISNCSNNRIKEALVKILKSSPRWTPGNTNGRPKDLLIKLPFNLKGY